jgi:REP element-mobilizing transposase RayT
MPSKKIKTPIETGCTYHIFNRGNNYQDVFFRDEDYYLFLEKLKLYLNKCCSVYAFALMANHYHLLLRVNDDLDKSVFSQQFLKFILSYTNKINFREQRNGSLFLSYFRRIKIEDDEYLKRLVYYINHNPVKHRIVENFRTYKFCSYPILISDKPTDLARDEVIDFFGGLQDLIEYHNYLHDEDEIKRFTFEDD